MTTTMVKPVGTLDHARPATQMQAIDLILCFYFKRSDWLRARAEARPNKLTR